LEEHGKVKKHEQKFIDMAGKASPVEPEKDLYPPGVHKAPSWITTGDGGSSFPI
jgi:hypothetical protein